MNIKQYNYVPEHVDNIDEIVLFADEKNKELEDYTSGKFNYDQDLYELYYDYMLACNVHMFAFLDFIKGTYDRIDTVKDIFKKDKPLFNKITKTLEILEQNFEQYYFMCDRIDELEEEYNEEFTKYKLRNVTSEDYDPKDMEMKFKYICSFHYELVDRMYNYIHDTAQPYLDIANAIYNVEMDFNKALGLKEEQSEPKR